MKLGQGLTATWGETKRIEGLFDEAQKQAMLLDAERRDEALNHIAVARSQIKAPDALVDSQIGRLPTSVLNEHKSYINQSHKAGFQQRYFCSCRKSHFMPTSTAENRSLCGYFVATNDRTIYRNSLIFRIVKSQLLNAPALALKNQIVTTWQRA